MPSLFVNSCILQYTTITNDNGLTLTITGFSRSSEITKYTSRRLYIAVDAKNVISVMEKQTPTEAKILSSMNHRGKATAEQKREAKVYRANQLQNNREDAFTRFVNAFNTKKNNNQLTFTYTKKDIEQNVTLKLCLFGEVVQVVLKVPRNEITPTPGTREESKTIGIEKVNNGKNYVINEAAYAKYGHIERVVDFSDVEDEKQLLSLANIYVNNLQFDDISIEISAVDLHHLTGTIPSFELLDEIRCISRPHGLDRTFPLTEITIPLDDPSGVTYKLGRSGSTTMSQSTAANAVDLFKRINSMPSPNRILDTAKVEMSNILNNRTTGYVNIVQENDISQALVISNSADWRHATKLWKFDMNGLGYSDSTISNPGRYDNATTINADDRLYKIGMTMDGTIVADFIKTGLLEDGLGYNYWNLSTGEFRLSPNTLLDVDNLDGSIATVSDLVDQVEDAKDEAELAVIQEYNASNILRKSDDFSVLNQPNKDWADGNWKTSTTKPNSPNLCKIEIVDSYANPVNADVPSAGVSKAVAFRHTSSYSSPSSLQTEIYQNGIQIATDTVYTLACYACGQGSLYLKVMGQDNKVHRIYLDHSGWKRYNIVFQIKEYNYDISAERTRLSGLKHDAEVEANNYENEYKNLQRAKAPSSEIKAAKKQYSIAQKEVKKYEAQLSSLDMILRRTDSGSITVTVQHSGLGNACVAGLTLMKGNVSKDWQPSDDDFFSIKTSIEEKLNMQYLMDKLTDGGKKQGVYMENGILLINAEYIMAGLLTDKHRYNTWDLENGRLRTTNMVATNIQANGVLQSVSIAGYRGPNKPVGNAVRIEGGGISFYRLDQGKETKYSSIYESAKGMVITGGQNHRLSLMSHKLFVYPYYNKYLSGGRVKGWRGSALEGLDRIIRIKGVTYNKKNKLTYTILAEMTFTHGILTKVNLYDKTKGKLRTGGRVGKYVQNYAYILMDNDKYK